MMQAQENKIQPYRPAIVLICYGLSFIVIGISVMLFIHACMRFPQLTRHEIDVVALNFISLFSWLAVFVIGLRWAKDPRVHGLWPMLGSIAGVIFLLIIPEILLFLWPAFMLAIFFVGFHLKHRSQNIIRTVKYLIYPAGLLPFILALVALCLFQG